jgi:hypothetical protein
MFIDQKVKVWSKPSHEQDGVIRVTFGRITLALSLVEASWLASNIQREIRAVEMTDYHRGQLKPGDRVIVRDDNGIEADYLVQSEPWQLGHGEWVIKLAGISGGYSLDRVVRFLEARPCVAMTTT